MEEMDVIPRKVVNFPDHKLNDVDMCILKRGLGFVIASKTIPIENII